ncbi:MAG: DUF2442 domain-containing protein [Lewinellaceae bacterium]|nr:DUF2442 domain-containing protein [Lewinellaceae bacterium]
MHKLIEIKPIPDYQIWIRFEDGSEGIVDLSHLKGKGVFAAWGKTIAFEQAYIDSESGALAWSKNLDIDPLNLYLKINKISFYELTLKEVH